MSARPEHDRIAELLPWFVNGTLDEAERRVVERHVRECLPCRMSLQDERRMARLIQAQPLAPLSVDANFGRLMQRIDREAAPATNGRRRNRRIARAGPLVWLQLGAAAAVIALLTVGVQTLRQQPAEPTANAPYSTASDATAAGPRIDIVFAESITEPELRALLLEIDGTVVAGPTDIGRYTIELHDPDLDAAALDRVVDELQRDPRIRLAARSFIAP